MCAISVLSEAKSHHDVATSTATPTNQTPYARLIDAADTFLCGYALYAAVPLKAWGSKRAWRPSDERQMLDLVPYISNALATDPAQTLGVIVGLYDCARYFGVGGVFWLSLTQSLHDWARPGESRVPQ